MSTKRPRLSLDNFRVFKSKNTKKQLILQTSTLEFDCIKIKVNPKLIRELDYTKKWSIYRPI
jgi:hypothetical protein